MGNNKTNQYYEIIKTYPPREPENRGIFRSYSVQEIICILFLIFIFFGIPMMASNSHSQEEPKRETNNNKENKTREVKQTNKTNTNIDNQANNYDLYNYT